MPSSRSYAHTKVTKMLNVFLAALLCLGVLFQCSTTHESSNEQSLVDVTFALHYSGFTRRGANEFGYKGVVPRACISGRRSNQSESAGVLAGSC